MKALSLYGKMEKNEKRTFTMAIILPDLPYAYDALEPYIDAETMTLHHDKHHATYVANANAALEKHPEIGEDLEALLADVEKIPADIRQALINLKLFQLPTKIHLSQTVKNQSWHLMFGNMLTT